MATILIDCAPDAEPEARALAAGLAARGRAAILGLDHKAARGQVSEFDAVVVVWSREGRESETLLALASAARKAGRLVSARQAGLPRTGVPVAHREASMPLAGEIDEILARLPPPSDDGEEASLATGEGAAGGKRIYLSHAMKDRGVAAAVADELRRAGHDVFLADADLQASDDFEAKIRDAIARSDLTVALISPAFLESPYGLAELELSQREGGSGRILPALIVPTNLAAVPDPLRGCDFLVPAGDIAKEIAAAVERHAVSRGGEAPPGPEGDDAGFAGPAHGPPPAPAWPPGPASDDAPLEETRNNDPLDDDAYRLEAESALAELTRKLEQREAEQRARRDEEEAARRALEQRSRRETIERSRREEFRPAPEAPRRVGAAEPAPDWLRELESLSGRAGPGAARAQPPKSSRPEGVGAADPLGRKPLAKAAPATDALAAEAGKLVHKIPSKMWLGEPETVEVRLGREAAAGLAHGLVGRGALTEEFVPIVETMSVSLYARGGAFEIERQSETTQLVKHDALRGTPFEGAGFGRWVWQVTPKKTGAHQLCVKVSAGLKDSRGVPTTATLPDREFAVSVSVHTGKEAKKILGRVALGVGGVIAASLIGAVTQDFWWPWIKALFLE